MLIYIMIMELYLEWVALWKLNMMVNPGLKFYFKIINKKINIKNWLSKTLFILIEIWTNKNSIFYSIKMMILLDVEESTHLNLVISIN